MSVLGGTVQITKNVGEIRAELEGLTNYNSKIHLLF